jgi:polyhydroxyalkanoate synthesis regulator phasin
MLGDVRNYLRAGIGAVTSHGSEGLPDQVVARGQALAQQLSSFASGFLEWSGEARASLLTELKLLIAGQVEEMGLASKQDVERLRERLDRMEEALDAARGSSSGAAARGQAKRSASASAAKSRRASSRTSSSGRPSRTAKSRASGSTKSHGSRSSGRSSPRRASGSSARRSTRSSSTSSTG